tara:strand:+ start:257 stop:970 length:714 start_codon:yes stop_codon:yes gene_type:complete
LKNSFLVKCIFTISFCSIFVSCISLKQYPLESYGWAAPEIRQFEFLDKTVQYPDDAILFIGSSSIRLWSTLEQDMNPFSVIQRGYGGAHFRDLIFYTDRILANHAPELVVCFVANDIKGVAEDESPKKILRLIKYFEKQVRSKLPSTPIVFIEITPTSSRWKQWNDIQKVNELLKEYCTTKEDLYFVETAAAFLNKEGKPKDELFISDRLHLNSEGYVLWNQLIKKRLITIKEKAIL